MPQRTPVLPVTVAACLVHGPERRRIELQRDASGALGRLVSPDGDRTRWMDWDAALGLWRLTWGLLEALGVEVV